MEGGLRDILDDDDDVLVVVIDPCTLLSLVLCCCCAAALWSRPLNNLIACWGDVPAQPDTGARWLRGFEGLILLVSCCCCPSSSEDDDEEESDDEELLLVLEDDDDDEITGGLGRLAARGVGLCLSCRGAEELPSSSTTAPPVPGAAETLVMAFLTMLLDVSALRCICTSL